MMDAAQLRIWCGLTAETASDALLDNCIDTALGYCATYMHSKGLGATGQGFDVAVSYHAMANLLDNLNIRGIKPSALTTAGISISSDPTAGDRLRAQADKALYNQAVANTPNRANLYIRHIRSGKMTGRI